MAPTNLTFPTETIDLPSRGWFYPAGHPLASGQLDIFYLTAKHEDILTSKNLIQKGIVLDRLLEAVIANQQVKLDDLLLGDKAAIMVASRILGYGKDYDINVTCPSCDKKNEVTIDLQNLHDKACPFFTEEFRGKNEFMFTLPMTKLPITFKFLTHADETSIRAELDSLRKISKSDIDREITTRLRRSITSVNGETNGEKIRTFVDSMPARDAMEFRNFLRKTVPDVDLSTDFVCKNCDYEGRVDIPIDINFFWPNARV